MKSYYIHFFRNGTTVANGTKQYIGVTDVELSTNGIEQLNELKQKYDYLNPTVVFSSPLKRCTETAKIIFDNKKIIVLPELRECDFGDFEGKTPEELIDDMRYNDFIKHGTAAPNGESQETFSRRVCAAFGRIVRDMMKSGVTETAICTHGGVIMLLLSVYGLPRANMLEWKCNAGEGYTVKITPSVWMRTGMVEVTNLYPVNPLTEEMQNENSDEEEFVNPFWADDSDWDIE